PTVRQHLDKLRDEIQRATGRIPRELNKFFGKDFREIEFTADEIERRLKTYEETRQAELSWILKGYYLRLDPMSKTDIRRALADVFLRDNQHLDAVFDCKFLDFGIVYQYEDPDKASLLILKRPITPASEAALFELYKSCPLPDVYKDAIKGGTLNPAQFSDAFFQSLIKSTDIVFKSTNLAGKEEQILELRVNGYQYLQKPPRKLGDEGKNILIHGCELAPFDFILGYTFIQISISNFQKHNDGSANVDLAFTSREHSGERNQIEYFLDHTYGGTHKAEMEETELVGKPKLYKRNFKVTRNGVMCPDFRIVYIRGKNDFCE
ncbi:hypothetical protein BX616_007786, partial [Lobosporangium transversale]